MNTLISILQPFYDNDARIIITPISANKKSQSNIDHTDPNIKGTRFAGTRMYGWHHDLNLTHHVGTPAQNNTATTIYAVYAERNAERTDSKYWKGLIVNVGKTTRTVQARLKDRDYNSKNAGGDWKILKTWNGLNVAILKNFYLKMMLVMGKKLFVL